ncbi:hypothetical protein Psyaliredsea_21260 [Psychrobacter alimentarius]
MQTQTILAELFPNELEYQIDNWVIRGSAETKAGTVEIIGTVDSAAINQAIAIRLANEVLDVIAQGKKHRLFLLLILKGRILLAPMSCCV